MFYLNISIIQYNAVDLLTYLVRIKSRIQQIVILIDLLAISTNCAELCA